MQPSWLFVWHTYVDAVLKQEQSLPKSVTLVTRHKSMPEMHTRDGRNGLQLADTEPERVAVAHRQRSHLYLAK